VTPGGARKRPALPGNSSQQQPATPSSTQRRSRPPHNRARRTTATPGNARQRLSASSNNTQQRPATPSNAPKRPAGKKWLRSSAWRAHQRQPGDANPATATHQRQPTSVGRETTAHGDSNGPPSLSLERTPPRRFGGRVGRAGAGGPARSLRRARSFPEPGAILSLPGGVQDGFRRPWHSQPCAELRDFSLTWLQGCSKSRSSGPSPGDA